MQHPYATDTAVSWTEPTAIIGVAWAEPRSSLKGMQTIAPVMAPRMAQGAGKRTHTAGE